MFVEELDDDADSVDGDKEDQAAVESTKEVDSADAVTTLPSSTNKSSGV